MTIHFLCKICSFPYLKRETSQSEFSIQLDVVYNLPTKVAKKSLDDKLLLFPIQACSK
jgi:hypothetical protein